MKGYTIFVFSLFVVILILNTKIDCKDQENKRNYENCDTNEECASKSCVKSKCQPKKCRNDKACLKVGLSDHYCRKRTIFKIFDSECVPKRGFTKF